MVMVGEARVPDHRVIFRICCGDIGALIVCNRILWYGKDTDPDFDCRFFLDLYRLHIVGYKIYELWNGVCGRSVSKMIILVRACMSGLAGLNRDVLRSALEEGAVVNLEAVLQAVKEKFPRFKTESSS